MTTLVDALAFTMYIGAANWDATPQQREQLRQDLLPLLDAYRADGHTLAIERAVRAVMGRTWVPSGGLGRHAAVLRQGRLGGRWVGCCGGSARGTTAHARTLWRQSWSVP